ncbi:DinB family protein [Terriglobus sp.]|uniref:DinB family protein n=1 Tax=Terriglobus sp. TaxID=1889013 RepID=UPI003B004326
MLYDEANVEPWLRGTRQESPPLLRAVLHAFDLTREDFARWVWPFDAELLEQQPYGLPSVGFQARHIARSLDRLLTYAEGNQLSEAQHALLATEHIAQGASETRDEFEAGLLQAERRTSALPLAALDEPRYVGRATLPATLAGLLVHLADHTQRHAGQAVTTAKLLRSLHGAEQS